MSPTNVPPENILTENFLTDHFLTANVLKENVRMVPNQSILCKINIQNCSLSKKLARAEKTGQSLPRFLEVSRGSFLKILCLTHQTICFSNSFHEIKRFMAIMNSSTIKQAVKRYFLWKNCYFCCFISEMVKISGVQNNPFMPAESMIDLPWPDNL